MRSAFRRAVNARPEGFHYRSCFSPYQLDLAPHLEKIWNTYEDLPASWRTTSRTFSAASRLAFLSTIS
jgi:hypothetical protein